MQHSRYHKLLRVSLVVVALVLLFDGGYVSSLSKQFSDTTIQYLASSNSGVSVSVEPTELNTYTAELTKRDRDLDDREAALAAREISTRDFNASGEERDFSIYVLSSILFILTVLIMLNYAMDWSRVRRIQYEKQST